MESTTKSSAGRRYTYRVLVAMALYCVFLVADVWIFRHYHPAAGLAWLLALLPALPIIGVLAAAGLYLAEVKDEFRRAIMVQSMLWSMGGTLAVTTVWGFLESFAQVRHIEWIWVFPIFCVFVPISGVVVGWKYR
jgi:hypothetical protein